MSDYLSGLNAAQKKAVMHNAGPLLVLAGAGSGKTRVLTTRVARLVKQHVCPASGILAVTFTNKAAREMQERIAKLVGPKPAQAMTVCTFHSLGARILREDGHLLGLQRHFTILDDHQRTAAIKGVLRSTGRAAKDEDHEKLAVAISLAKNGGVDPSAVDEEQFGIKGRKVYAAYTQVLLKRQSVDFDDLLLLPMRLFEKHPEALQKYQKKFRYVSVDEFQDTNSVQTRLARMLAAPELNLMVVGDDDQGIYSWRGAVLDNILTFPNQFAGCKTVILDTNYRSTSQILEGAHAVVSKNPRRSDKKIVAANGSGEPIMHYKGDDEDDEAEWLAKKIVEHVDQKKFVWKDHALLLRANAQMRRFEEALRRNRVPYRTVGSRSFFDRKEIRDVMAYLRFFANHDDEVSLERMLKVPNKGFATATLQAIDEFSASRRWTLWTGIAHCGEIDELQGEQPQRLTAFRDFCLKHDAALRTGALAQGFRAMLDECGYLPALRQSAGLGPEDAERLQNVEEVLHGLETFEHKHKNKKQVALSDYLQELALLTADEQEDEAEKGKTRNAVTLMTLHKSKGLEFPVVFLAGLDDALIPSPRTVAVGKIDEERRLFYVGMTRAMKLLILTFPATKVFRTKSMKVTPCRFLWEIPEEFLDGKIGEKEDTTKQEFVTDFFKQMQEKFAPPVEEEAAVETPGASVG